MDELKYKKKLDEEEKEEKKRRRKKRRRRRKKRRLLNLLKRMTCPKTWSLVQGRQRLIPNGIFCSVACSR